LSYLLTQRFFRFGLFGRCVKADAATDLTAFGVFGLASSFAALLATFFDVTSLFLVAIFNSLKLRFGCLKSDGVIQ
jgi:hypothetical protein